MEFYFEVKGLTLEVAQWMDDLGLLYYISTYDDSYNRGWALFRTKEIDYDEYDDILGSLEYDGWEYREVPSP